MSLKRAVRYYYTRFKRLQGSTHALALGSAIGAAIGVTPTVPFHIILVLALTPLLRINPIAGILAVNVVSNPLTIIPQYYLAWKIGDFFLPGRLNWEKIRDTLTQINLHRIGECFELVGSMGWDALLVMLTGGLIMAVPTGAITYTLMFRFFAAMRSKRRRKHLLNNDGAQSRN
jgi:uncharacterized protein (DUF2062 family)